MFAPSNYSELPMNSDYSKAIVEALETKNVTYNFHHKCITDKSMEEADLNSFYRPLAYSMDAQGKEFVAAFESIKYPFFGVQFHPEKPPFEFVVKRSQHLIPHSREAIAVSRYFADFFVSLARMNGHNPASGMSFERSLIYSFNPMYTGIKNDMYEQRYLFPFKNNGLSTEEFLDYSPDDNEEAPEELIRLK